MSKLEIRNATKKYPAAKRFALTDANLSVAPGSIHGVVGPNGAGKSTLFYAIAGLLTLDDGEIKFGDAVKRGTCFLLTEGSGGLYPEWTVWESFRYAGAIASSTGKLPSKLETDAALRRGGLDHCAFDQVSTLSFGTRQRLLLSIALASGASILLLDEPTNGLDIKEAREFCGYVKALSASKLPIILFSSHQPEIITQLAHEVTFLSLGKTIRKVDSAEFSNMSVDEFLQLYNSIYSEQPIQ